jgi:basic amino acid/polyamine antiporter, APA family
LEASIAETERAAYTRVLGPVSLTALGVAAIIGAGVFVLTGKAAAEVGPFVVFSYLFAGVACIFAALAYAEMAGMIPSSGSAYSYAYASLGRLPAFGMGWLVLLAYAGGNMVVAIGWSAYLRSGLESLGYSLPEVLSKAPAAGGVFDAPAAIIALAVTALVILGIRESAGTTTVLTAFKIVVVLGFVAVGVFYIDPANFAGAAEATSWGPLFGASAILFFAYIGFDTVAATSEEARNPRRDVPIAIVASLLICMVIYVLVAVVLTGMVRYDALDPVAPLARAFDGKLPGANHIVSLGAIVATTTVLLAFTIGLPRIMEAVARDGMLPKAAARIHPRFKTPVAATLISGIAVALGAGLLPLDDVVDLSVIATLLIYILVCVGVIVLKRVRPDARRPFRTHIIVPWLGVLSCGALLFSVLNAIVWLLFFLWMGLGLAIYGFYSHRRAVALTPSEGSQV